MVSRPAPTAARRAISEAGSVGPRRPGTGGPTRADPDRAPRQTEREGFEPSIRFYPYTRLAGVRLRPLGHLSRPPIGTRCSLLWRQGARKGTSAIPLTSDAGARTWSRSRPRISPRARRSASRARASAARLDPGYASRQDTRVQPGSRGFGIRELSRPVLARFPDRPRATGKLASARRWPTHGHTAPHDGTRVA